MPVMLLLLLSLPTFAAWPNGYEYRYKLTIQAAQVTGTLTDFTTCVCQAHVFLATIANGGVLASGFDFIFTTSDGATAAPYERTAWTAAAGSSELHVKLPSTSTGTEFYLYAGNSSDRRKPPAGGGK